MSNAIVDHDHFTAAAERLIGREEKLMQLGEACQVLKATRGEKVNTGTLARWITRGKNGVRLDAVKLNGKGWSTSREALVRFAAALSTQAAGVAKQATMPTQRERRARDAMDAMARDREREKLQRRMSR